MATNANGENCTTWEMAEWSLQAIALASASRGGFDEEDTGGREGVEGGVMVEERLEEVCEAREAREVRLTKLELPWARQGRGVVG